MERQEKSVSRKGWGKSVSSDWELIDWLMTSSKVPKARLPAIREKYLYTRTTTPHQEFTKIKLILYYEG
jgi:hypothetical protein